MQLGSVTIEGSLVLAPMAGVTDYAYRTICAEYGAALTVTEMVSSRALVYQDRKSKGLLRKTPTGICAAQIFGNDPEIMAQGAELAIAHSGCEILDINMGCPVGKIAGNGDGSALMKDPELAARIVEACCKAVSVPVTVKTRIGWDKSSINVVEFAKRLEQAGAAAVAVHGRTKVMQYSGVADWETIAKVRQAVSIPVIANGDIIGPQEAIKCRKWTGCEMLMVGRAAFGDPWVFSQIKAALNGEEIPERPELKDRIAVALRQFEINLEDKGEHIACLEARKYFNWYLRGVAYSGYYKEKISAIEKPEDVYAIVKGIQRDLR